MVMESIAPNAMALANEIDRQAKADPTKAAAFASLKTTLDEQTSGLNRMKNLEGIAKLETLLGEDAGFKANVRNLALRNPAALERIIPQALGNPDGMKALVAQTAATSLPRAAPAAARPAAAAVAAAPATAPAAARPAPTIQSEAKPAPAAVAAAAEKPAAPARPAAERPAEPVQAAAAPAAEQSAAPVAAATGNRVLDRMTELSKTAGYDDLMNRIEKNPQLSDMFSALTSGNGNDPAATEQALDDILQQTRKNPNALVDLVKTIDEKPGVVSSIAANMANDPKGAMMAIGMYSQFNQGFGKLLGSLFGEGALDRVIVGLIGAIAPMLGSSGALMSMSNNGGNLTRQALAATNGKPSEVNVVDAENGAVVTRSGEQFLVDGRKTGTPAQPTQPNEQDKARLGADVSMQPSMSAG